MFRRQTSGSVICTSCGVLVGVNDDQCYNCGRRNPGLWGFAPALRALGGDMGFVPFVIGACAVLYVLSLVASQGQIGMGGLFSLLSPSQRALFLFGASGSIPVFALDRWWTVLSAGWLHGGALHILFNMMWVRQLAPATADLYGPGRMVIIYTTAGVAGFALSSFAGAFVPNILFLRGGQFTVGASASIFGLLGALVHYGRRGGSRMVGSEALSYALMLGVFGFIMPGVDNYAHAGGFGGGWLAARVLDPLKPERIDHIAIAVVCLAATLLAVVVSAVTGFVLLAG
ncbi:MAG: rhomboid family intramembrane serine protease [Acidimicrobiia bacterium]|nr:rhomboid family intramembrane serine protease [Acidimicrobiia bacterium]